MPRAENRFMSVQNTRILEFSDYVLKSGRLALTRPKKPSPARPASSASTVLGDSDCIPFSKFAIGQYYKIGNLLTKPFPEEVHNYMHMSHVHAHAHAHATCNMCMYACNVQFELQKKQSGASVASPHLRTHASQTLAARHSPHGRVFRGREESRAATPHVVPHLRLLVPQSTLEGVAW